MIALRRIQLFLVKLFNYEFWPYWLFYIPMYLYGVFLAIRAGSFTYFTAANPIMIYGGVFGNSKFDVLQKQTLFWYPGGCLSGYSQTYANHL